MQIRAVIGCSLAALALFSVGCATTRSFKVDAISAAVQATGKTYHVVPANPQVSDNDLRFLEASGIIEKALAARGYTRVPATSDANLVIAIDATLGQPENIAVTQDVGPVADCGFYHSARIPVRTRSGRICFVHTMVWAPNYYPEHQETSLTTLYEKRLTLTAFSNDGSKDLPQLWSVIVTERDESSDIRSLMPMMAVAAAKYAEADTKGQVILSLNPKNPDVARITPVKSDDKQN